ncbi:MAG: hypothetical protein PHH52_02570 [Patescibacteria group bacterium]|nr:hypothetical protein [Patescibacteria group bacterium]
MKIKDLPSGGTNFRSSVGNSSFAKKLSAATRVGSLQNLADNKQAIMHAVKHYEKAIKRGKFDSSRQRQAWEMIKKKGSNLSKNDEKEIKSLFKHLSKTSSDDAKKDSQVQVNKDMVKDTGFLDEKNKALKERLKTLENVSVRRNTSMKFVSGPQDTAAARSGVNTEVLNRRLSLKESMLKSRLPRERVSWQEEKKKRFEVSSLHKDMNVRPTLSAKDKKKEEKNISSFQNL